MEIHFADRLDPERLRAAALDACERHPLARARMLPVEPGDRAYHWEIQSRAAAPELDVVECDRDGAPTLAAARDRFLGVCPSLESAPPFRLALLRAADGDVLAIHIHHAVSDGLGTWRLLTSMMCAYAGLEDPLPELDPLRARELRPLVLPPTRRERWRRAVKVPGVLLRNARPVRMAPEGGRDGDLSEGVCLIAFDERDVATLQRLRQGQATLTDVLVGGLALAIRRWNAAHDADGGKLTLIVPVNIRPPAWREEVMGNFASMMPVSIGRRVPAELPALIAEATRRTQKAKRDNTALALFDVLPAFMSRLRVETKRRMGSREPAAVERMQDTAVLSNLGRLALPDLGDKVGAVRAVWVAPPAGFTRGVTMVVLSYDGRLQLGVGYQRAHLGDEAAAAFAALYRRTLLDVEDERSPAAGDRDYSSTTSVSPSLTA